MSNKIVNAIRPLAMTPTQKFVLHCLADEANDQGVCWPSVAAIMEKTCMGERTVRRAIADLETLGLVHADRRSGRATSYDLSPAMQVAAQSTIPLPERQGCRSGRGAGVAPQPLPERQDTPAAAAPHPCRSGTPILDPPEIHQGSTTTARELWGQFVLVYPNKGRLDTALPLWEQLTEDDQRRALAVAKDQVGKPAWQREGFRFVPSADKWLKRRDFDKYPNPLGRPSAAPVAVPPPLSPEARAAGSAQAKAARAAIAGRAA